MSPDDSEFKKASGILKVFALGAHKVRSHTSCMRNLAGAHNALLVLPLQSRVERVLPSQPGARWFRHQALRLPAQDRSTRGSSSRDPRVSHTCEQAIRLLGHNPLHEAAVRHAAQPLPSHAEQRMGCRMDARGASRGHVEAAWGCILWGVHPWQPGGCLGGLVHGTSPCGGMPASCLID